ncbi:DUF1801 domain-containing protein [uncultured Flavobacterium sp.]|uniref:DUF1801 domain-containing protein n=1 Tax=uncultured Flavobacterium sp. TaxID=165435 RepID=UPI0025F3EB3C|nr:DUF1801 domain-containing protein [uncultured Flavobacterium sp.]
MDKAINEVRTVNALEHYYDKQETATRECLIALKSIVLSVDENIIHKRKYQIPFFSYYEYNLGFLWVHKKKILLGFIQDKKSFPTTEQRIKDNVTTLQINPLDEIPIDDIKETFRQLVEKYNKNLRTKKPSW